MMDGLSLDTRQEPIVLIKVSNQTTRISDEFIQRTVIMTNKFPFHVMSVVLPKMAEPLGIIAHSVANRT